MKRVYQTKFGIGKGNCLLACVASILERNIEDIPDFNASGVGWFDELYEWCRNQNIGLLYFTADEIPKMLFLNCYAILVYEVIGFDENHAIVGKAMLNKDTYLKSTEGWEWNIEQRFDPNPIEKKLGKLKFIVALLNN